jgi:hypothetical protein
VPLVYRVFPFLASARPDAPGGPLYIPQQGAGRLDNPGTFSVLYLSDAAPGAIAEALGRFPEWTAAVLRGSPALPGSAQAIASYALPEDAPICNLDDPHQLSKLTLRPSDVVSRDYTRTRGWALRIYQEQRWIGARWWSYYDPQWFSIGLWDITALILKDVHLLDLEDTALVEASRTILRRIVPAR